MGTEIQQKYHPVAFVGSSDVVDGHVSVETSQTLACGCQPCVQPTIFET